MSRNTSALKAVPTKPKPVAKPKPVHYQDKAYLQHLQRQTMATLMREALERIVKSSLDGYSRQVAQQAIDLVRGIERDTDDVESAVRMARCSATVLRAVAAGFASDPGTSDLDNEQPITVRMTLGDWRMACAAVAGERAPEAKVSNG